VKALDLKEGIRSSSLNCWAGLPDGIFSNQKSQFGKIWEGFGVEKVGIYYGHFKYIAAIWYIL
jgi:hypothetical protein